MFVFIFVLSGLVLLEDFVFVVFIMFYLVFMNVIIFKFVMKGFFFNVMVGSNWVQKYVFFVVGVGFVVFLSYVFGSFVYGDQRVLKVIVFYLFFFGCQILIENVIFRNNRVLLFMCVLVFIFYNVWCLFIIVEWVKVDFYKGVLESMGMYGVDLVGFIFLYYWILMGRYLVIVNLIVWVFNFFFFLILVFLFRIFRKYYELDVLVLKIKVKDVDFDNVISIDFQIYIFIVQFLVLVMLISLFVFGFDFFMMWGVLCIFLQWFFVLFCIN